jgi:hypothetical protein
MATERPLRLLNENRAVFVVIGATAFPAYGYARATLDIDLFVKPTRANIRRVMKSLREFGYDLSDFSAVHEDPRASEKGIRGHHGLRNFGSSHRCPEGYSALFYFRFLFRPGKDLIPQNRITWTGSLWGAGQSPGDMPRFLGTRTEFKRIRYMSPNRVARVPRASVPEAPTSC